MACEPSYPLDNERSRNDDMFLDKSVGSLHSSKVGEEPSEKVDSSESSHHHDQKLVFDPNFGTCYGFIEKNVSKIRSFC